MPSSAADTTTLTSVLQEEIAATLGVPHAALQEPDTRTLRERGLTSLQAIRVQYRVEERSGVQLGLAELLDASDLRALAQRLAGSPTPALPLQE
ncbi:hypothetical protein ANT2_1417 [plant metagenome]|uniref:Carrier domain-containing protein n=1 Tax=plant metagenome TaxID=1297885 RepID=A0A484PVZ2_9ZZZZ